MGKFGLNFFKPTEKFNGNWSVLEHKSREWEKMYRKMEPRQSCENDAWC